MTRLIFKSLITILFAAVLISPATAFSGQSKAANAKQSNSPFDFFNKPPQRTVSQTKRQKQVKLAALTSPSALVATIDRPTAKTAAQLSAQWEAIAGQLVEQMEAELPKFHSVRRWNERSRSWEHSLVHGPSSQDITDYLERKKQEMFASSCPADKRGTDFCAW